LANSKTQKAFLFTVNAIFRHDYPLAVEPGSTPGPLVQTKTWRDSLPIDMLLSAVSILVVAQSSSEIPERLMNNPVYDIAIIVEEKLSAFPCAVQITNRSSSFLRDVCTIYQIHGITSLEFIYLNSVLLPAAYRYYGCRVGFSLPLFSSLPSPIYSILQSFFL